MTKAGDASGKPVLVWLRNDLRLDDNPALAHAAHSGRPVLPLFVLEDGEDDVRPPGAAHRWWLHHSLTALGKSLSAAGSPLILRRGRSSEIVPEIARSLGAGTVMVNRRYAHGERAVDEAVAQALGNEIGFERFTGHILHEPESVETKTGGYYRVYTPFWKRFANISLRDPMDRVSELIAPEKPPRSDELAEWGLLPTGPDWSGGMAKAWTPGEDGAHRRFDLFLRKLLQDYVRGRETPAEDGTSRMSPYLRFGEVSPYRLWQRASAAAAKRETVPAAALTTFRQELVWRDFGYHLLYHAKPLEAANFNQRFDALEWRNDAAGLKAWRKGLTGYPIVDAGMRQLWEMGWMHNRVRMIVGSLLCKDLLIHWHEGERWFWDTLVDGDVASNASQWQWIAGTGADAQPFFRVFNPRAQSEKFDPTGEYIRRFVPELAKLTDKAIHAPAEADDAVLKKAGVLLGRTYPHPILDHGVARERALAAFKATRG